MPVGIRQLCSVGLVSLCALVGGLVFASAPAMAAAEAPKVEEAFTSNVTSSSATLNATVNPGGVATTYKFEYALVGGVFAPVAESEGSGTLPAGTTGVALSVHVQQGLLPNASYEFRVVASNTVEGVSGGPVSFTMQETGGEFVLPDGRQYEMVTPPQKEGALFLRHAYFYEQGDARLMQAAADGNAIADLAKAPTEVEAQGNAIPLVSVLSTRGPDGWSSQVIAPPRDRVATSTGTEGGEYRMFSEDLSRAIVEPIGPFEALSPEATEQTPYLRTDYLNGNIDEHCQTGCFQPLVTRSDDTASPFEPFGEPGCVKAFCGPELVGASPNLDYVIFSSVPLTSDPTGLYEWSAGEPASERLQPMSVLPESEGGGAVGGGPDGDGRGVPGSGIEPLTNGGWYFFSYGGHLYVHDSVKDESFRLDVARGVGEPPTGAAEFLYASSDGSRVFFSDSEQLTSAVGGGIYDCQVVEVAGALTCGELELTDLESTGLSAGALLGGSEDASYLYFTGTGGTLYVDYYNGREWTTTKGLAGFSTYAAEFGKGNLYRVSPNGEWLAFMSSEELTGYDNHDAIYGQPDKEVYEYNARTERLVCASCDPTGVRPVGVDTNASLGWVAANVPGWTAYTDAGSSDPPLHQPRYLSDSGRLFFESVDALVPADVDGTEDVYEYEPTGVPAGEHACSASSTSASEVYKPARSFEAGGMRGEEGAGCVALISAGTSSEESSLIDASETGGDVFFLTTSKLAPQDFDDAPDVYDAHECTSESPCIPLPASPLPPCTTEASCKPSPKPQPSIYGLPASATFTGSGNVVSSTSSPPRRVTKKEARCRQGKKLSHGRCLGIKRKLKKSKKINRASNHRRANR
jgi:hypothetical protein